MFTFSNDVTFTNGASKGLNCFLICSFFHMGIEYLSMLPDTNRKKNIYSDQEETEPQQLDCRADTSQLYNCKIICIFVF